MHQFIYFYKWYIRTSRNFRPTEPGYLPERMPQRLTIELLANDDELVGDALPGWINLTIFYNNRRIPPNFKEVPIGMVRIAGSDEGEVKRLTFGFFKRGPGDVFYLSELIVGCIEKRSALPIK